MRIQRKESPALPNGWTETFSEEGSPRYSRGLHPNDPTQFLLVQMGALGWDALAYSDKTSAVTQVAVLGEDFPTAAAAACAAELLIGDLL